MTRESEVREVLERGVLNGYGLADAVVILNSKVAQYPNHRLCLETEYMQWGDGEELCLVGYRPASEAEKEARKAAATAQRENRRRAYEVLKKEFEGGGE